MSPIEAFDYMIENFHKYKPTSLVIVEKILGITGSEPETKKKKTFFPTYFKGIYHPQNYEDLNL